MNDLRAQLGQMRRMGGLGALAGMIPGMKKAQQAMASGAVDERILLHMDAMIGSMTPKERGKPELINAKRKIRIAKGSGTTVQDVNKLMKMHLEMSTAMKRIKKMGGLKGLMGDARQGGGGGLGGLGTAHGRRADGLGGARPERIDGQAGRAGWPARLPAARAAAGLRKISVRSNNSTH